MNKEKKNEIIDKIECTCSDAVWIGKILARDFQGVCNKKGDDAWEVFDSYLDMVQSHFDKIGVEVEEILNKEVRNEN